VLAEVVVEQNSQGLGFSASEPATSKKNSDNYDYVSPHQCRRSFPSESPTVHSVQFLCSTLGEDFHVRTTPHYDCLAITVRKRPLGAHYPCNTLVSECTVHDEDRHEPHDTRSRTFQT
jgi:hypothetical protein